MGQREDTDADDETMELSFEDAFTLAGSKDEIWSSISDPEVLAHCIPGAESVEQVSRRKYTVEIVRGISHLTIELSGDVELVEMNEPEWIVADGHAYDPRTHSDIEGVAAMEMTELDSGEVRIDYKATINFTGGVTSIPTGMIERVVTSDVDAYFENVRSTIEDN